MKFNPSQNFALMNEAQRKLWENCHECVETLSKKYLFEHCNIPDLQAFQMIHPKLSPNVCDSWKVSYNGRSFDLCIMEYLSHEDHPSSRGGYRIYYSDPYLYGIAIARETFGRILIRPETTADKITEFFEKTEVDFPECPKFSRKYYLLSESRENAIRVMKPSLMNYLSDYSHLEMEFNSRRCAFRLQEAIDEKTADMLCQLGFGLDEILSR